MNIETTKIKFIEEFVTLQDEQLIRQLYSILREKQSAENQNLSDFAGVLSDEEAEQMMQSTQECRTIDTNEW